MEVQNSQRRAWFKEQLVAGRTGEIAANPFDDERVKTMFIVARLVLGRLPVHDIDAFTFSMLMRTLRHVDFNNLEGALWVARALRQSVTGRRAATSALVIVLVSLSSSV